MKKLLQSLFILLFAASTALAQDRTITGTVTSSDDKFPIPGVSIRVKGTLVGTVTDVNGKYSIKVPSASNTLEYTYIGYVVQSKGVGTSGTINVVLVSDSKVLNEVVVTALGISKDKKSLGYSTQSLNSEQLSSAANTSLAGSLQGKVSGVEVAPSSGMPGASAKVTIRGSRSFTGDNTPLYVVDGLPINSAVDIGTGNSVTGSDYANRGVDIDPNDIETINILKGQAASALYGMRANNGVIIITTKSGKGAAKGKPIITYNTNVTFDKVSVLPDFQSEYAQGSAGKFAPSASTSWGPLVGDLANDATYGGNTNNTYTNGSTAFAGKYYVPQRAAAGLDPWATPQTYNNVDDFFNTGHTYTNSINVVQALEKGSYAVTLGNTNSNGTIPSTGLNRYNAKISGEAILSSHFTAGFTGNLVNSKITKQSSANNGIVATLYGAPASYDLAGIPSNVLGDPYTQNTYRGTSGFDGVYWAVKNNQFLEKNQRFFGSTYVQYSSGLGTNNQKLTVKYQLGADSYTTNYVDLFGYGHANAKGEISQYSYTVNELNSLLTATYNWKINSDLSFDALVGNEFLNRDSRYNYAYGSNFNFSGFNHIDNASTYSASSQYLKRRTFGTFANASLAYKNMLYLNVTGRNDVVSSMPSNNRSYFYPSASLSWIFTELPALKNKVITYGKLRASFAQVGQAGTYLDSYYSVPTYGGGFSSGTPIIYPIGGISAYTPDATVYDPNLRPQNTNSFEFGTDLTFFGGIATLNYTFSRQNVKDQIFSVPLAGSTGSSSLVTNGGSIHTNAHEITLGFRPINKDKFTWDFAFNFSKIDNYVDALAPGVNSIFLGGFTEPQVRASIGEKFPTIYGISYLRNDAGQIVVDSNGFPQAGEETVIGRVSPDFLLGFNTTFTIHKLRIGAVLDWKQGGQMYSGTSGLLDFYGTSQYSADVRKAGTTFMFPEAAVKVVGTNSSGNPIYATNDISIKGENAQAYFTQLNSISESMIYDNSFVKLREVSLGYPVYEKKGLKVNLSAFARNILVWSAIKGIDPETSQGNTNMAGAFERFSLPGTSSYGFGVNVKF
ncbi:SusC/RagA family TonB-linked outer membrane protein [Pedobacter sp. BMA]|uniref:SusC/RagA family TonB-linked outer membrane protein n=1 Tax=Pedobacter sp. BMA TaxID=1663685 RepID=UPI00064B7D50|nr:SusC/RagA family TonB-linked outer membrane protein [Pedobacter sp. BMA]KLT64685.1 membrane protein [Pedobacter sp. BMA]